MSANKFLILALAASILHGAAASGRALKQSLYGPSPEELIPLDGLGSQEDSTRDVGAKIVEVRRDHTESRLIQTLAVGLLAAVFLFILVIACVYGGKQAPEEEMNADLKTVSVDVAAEQEGEKPDQALNKFLGLVIDAAHKEEKLPESLSVKVQCQPAKFVSEITPVEDPPVESPKNKRRHRQKCCCF